MRPLKRNETLLKTLTCLLVWINCSSSLLQAQARSKRSNIIFILADDLGYGDIGIYGQKKIETPNIDRLARMGVRFTQFYSGSTVCAPARCSFMTGLHTGHTAVRGNKTFQPEGQFPLPDSVVTFPMLLQQGGYATAAFGKWSLGFITTTGDPQQKGFDEFYGYNCQTLAHNYYPDHLWHNHERVNLSANRRYDSAYSADLIHQQAMQFLRADHQAPFFMYLPYTLPHADVFVPHDSVYDHYVKKFKERPAAIKTTDGEDHHVDPYPHAAFAAMVARLDKYVGEIMQVLKEKGIAGNTLIIFTSDNGPHHENGGDPVFFNSNGIFNGIKRDLYEGGIRVPFIAYQQGLTRPGTINNMPAALWDMYPTFLEMAGLRTSRKIDGFSLVPALMGKKQQQHAYLYWEFHEAGGKQAVRMGNWKAVRMDVNKTDDPPIELYDLATDPGEKNDLAAKYPAIVRQMKQLLKEAYVPDKNWPLLRGEF